LKRIDRSNDWAWATSGNQAVYFDWDGGEPNDAGANNTPEEQGENCVHIDTPEHSNGKWNDFPCHCVDQCKIGNTPNVPIYALCEAGPLDETPSTTAAPDYYKEHWRPQFHFSPETGWINDPNGLVYWGGEYHLFYQHYPDDTVWGPMHWGSLDTSSHCTLPRLSGFNIFRKRCRGSRQYNRLGNRREPSAPGGDVLVQCADPGYRLQP